MDDASWVDLISCMSGKSNREKFEVTLKFKETMIAMKIVVYCYVHISATFHSGRKA